MKYILILLLIQSTQIFCQSTFSSNAIWEIKNEQSIILRLDSLTSLPHKDNIEFSGKNVSSIIYYEIDDEFNLKVSKDIIFPQLRTYNKSNEPKWKQYRAYFRRTSNDDDVPKISYNEQLIVPSKVDSIEISGLIKFYYSPINGIQITKSIYPSMDDRLLVEEWEICNLGEDDKNIAVSNYKEEQAEKGYKGNYSFIIESKSKELLNLGSDETYRFPVLYGALLNEEKSNNFDFTNARQSRLDFLDTCRENLILDSPNDTLDLLFYFSKVRSAESIFNSSMGLIHSPGGGNYYVGIWANDQIEYSGPFFPYLGYSTGTIAAFNAYKKFKENIPQDESHIPYAFEVDGNFAMNHQDRGDAAMIAYGTSMYVLNSGSIEQAKDLWPLIQWSLEYCNRNRNEFGAVLSDSDEMEGRIETGDANLSTSTLYYGGLKFASRIANELGKEDLAETYEDRMIAMGQVIENYFGANLEGLDTYKYYEENKKLRHWICLPLTMGIEHRKEGTLKALFETLWTENGILVQYDPGDQKAEHTFWDRATLYALRGALKVGESKTSIEKLEQYSSKRLLKGHVPYAVEAYPENNMKHLSAESALYCRIYIEGILGVEPLGLSSLKLTPQLPAHWDFLNLDSVYLFGKPYGITVKREKGKLRVMVLADSLVIANHLLEYRQSFNLEL